MIIRKRSYSRAALIGNPSDGYFGKTIAFTFDAFFAEVTLYETPELEILPNERDQSLFRSIDQLAEDVDLYGYYGGIRLIKAAIKVFHRHCTECGIQLHKRNFTIRYHSTIPHLVGLAGSSAIITAAFRALMAYYNIKIENAHLANLVLAVEKSELGIAAGLQDRVAQACEGVVFMDFSQELIDTQGFGDYRPIDPSQLPNLYIAYRTNLSQGSEIFHNNIRHRFDRGEQAVVKAMTFWAGLTEKAKELLETGHGDELGQLLDQNFERRAELYKISEGNLKMIEIARKIGASAKFTGSGGAIIGTYSDDAMYDNLCGALEPHGVCVLKPTIVTQGESHGS